MFFRIVWYIGIKNNFFNKKYYFDIIPSKKHLKNNYYYISKPLLVWVLYCCVWYFLNIFYLKIY